MIINARTISALLYLIASKINGKKADLPEDISVEAVFALAKAHNLGALCASALSDISRCTPQMQEYRDKSIRKTLLFDSERAQISAILSKKGIAHIPLKGVILKELYPSLGDREMSDNDILIDPRHRLDVKEIFVNRGYEVKFYEVFNEDVYLKSPIFNFEIHASLFSNEHHELFYNYFSDTIEKSSQSFGECRKMRPEEFYIYLTAHENKHFNNSGIGIRSLLDAFLFLRKEELDKDYIQDTLKKLGFSEYEEKRTALTNKIFDPELSKKMMLGEVELSPEEEELLLYYAKSCTHGSNTNAIEKQVKNLYNGGRARYLFRRAVPDLEWYKIHAPFVYKYKFLIPFHVLMRLTLGLILSPRKIFKELKIVKNIKKKKK